MFMRGTWGEQAHYPLGHGAQITARAICYPREPNGFQPCHLVINILHPNEIKIDFKEGEFIVRDPSNHEHRFDTRNWSREYSKLTGTILIIVYLGYKKSPGEFELLLPDIAVNNNVHVIPAFRFKYEDTFLTSSFLFC